MKNKLKITINSPAVLGFAAICVCVLLLDTLTDGNSTYLLFMNYRSSLRDPFTWPRFILHIFGHTGWDHLIGNMSYILLLGPLLEEKYGSKVIMEIMLVVALVTGIFNYIAFPDCGLLGASGICFAFILLSSITSAERGEIPLTFILVAVIYLGQQVYDGVFLEDEIANFAHILGGIVGAVYGFLMVHGKR